MLSDIPSVDLPCTLCNGKCFSTWNTCCLFLLFLLHWLCVKLRFIYTDVKISIFCNAFAWHGRNMALNKFRQYYMIHSILDSSPKVKHTLIAGFPPFMGMIVQLNNLGLYLWLRQCSYYLFVHLLFNMFPYNLIYSLLTKGVSFFTGELIIAVSYTCSKYVSCFKVPCFLHLLQHLL